MKEEMLKVLKNNRIYIVLFCCLILFTIILIGVLNGNIQQLDSSIFNAIYSLKSNCMDLFFKTITRFGDEEVLIFIAIVCLIFIKNRKIGASIAINLASTGLINNIISRVEG